MTSSLGDADLAAVGALLSDRARAKVLLALLDGRSLPASMLAQEASVAASTASHHLARLVDAGFITVEARGRHKYFSLSGPHIAELIEAVARIAPAERVTSLREGTRAHAVRYARSCYDHLAGRLGVAVTDALREQGVLAPSDESASADLVTERGVSALETIGVPAQAGTSVRLCMDWTEQRHHIAGPLGRALLSRLLELEWLAADGPTRAVRLTDLGRIEFPATLGVEVP